MIMLINTLSVDFGTIWGKIWPILFAILFFGIIIALHEFGHFITAKIFKVKVNEFSIGMGPTLFKRVKGDTQYSLRLFPIGGFVSLEGEDEDSDDTRAFGNQKAWKRFIIIAAGATLNVILGLVLMGIVLGIDGRVSTTVVSDISTTLEQLDDSVKVGDKITKINGSNVVSARDLYYQLYRDDDGVFDITLKRGNEKITLTDVKIRYSAEEGYCDFVVGSEKVSALNIFPGAIKETASMTKLIFLSLADMLRGQYGLKDLSGPIGTIGIVAETAGNAVSSADYSGIIFILAFITVNIGIVNLLPLPALDGGRLFFIIIEGIFRKPVPKKFEAIVHAAGLILLLGLMVLISFNDIVNLVRK